MIQAKDLKELLLYDPDAGVFVWLKNRTGGIKAGDVAGSVFVSGYRYIKVLGRPIAEHRLAWLYMTGEWPPHHIDHINRVRADNRFCNLRLATPIQNISNRLHARRGTNLPGVCYRDRKNINPWEASIKHAGKSIHLGQFQTELEAHLTYAAALKEYASRAWGAQVPEES